MLLDLSDGGEVGRPRQPNHCLSIAHEQPCSIDGHVVCPEQRGLNRLLKGSPSQALPRALRPQYPQHHSGAHPNLNRSRIHSVLAISRVVMVLWFNVAVSVASPHQSMVPESGGMCLNRLLSRPCQSL